MTCSSSENLSILKKFYDYAKYPDGVFERAALMRGGPYEFRKTPVLDPLLERLAELGYIKPFGKGIFCLVDLPSIVKKEQKNGINSII